MISLGIGDILKVEKDGISYRVIAIVSGQYIYLCELNINKLIISVVSYAGVIEKISKKEFVLLPKENIIVDYSEIIWEYCVPPALPVVFSLFFDKKLSL